MLDLLDFLLSILNYSNPDELTELARNSDAQAVSYTAVHNTRACTTTGVCVYIHVTEHLMTG
jgi:hypothetical protein